MQTARAVTDVVSETINVVAFALASLLGSFALLGAIDWRVAGLFVIWLFVYFALIGWFLPRIRARAATRANARAAVSGQLVDTITNIKTVKLFAHDAHEDKVALDAMGKFRTQSLHYGWLAATFRFFLMVIAGILPVLLMGASIYFWQIGQATPGDIVAAGAVSIRIAQMTGWVSFTLMAIYSNIGEIEDGMHTLANPVRVEDAPHASDLEVPQGRITFENVSFQYGNALSLTARQFHAAFAQMRIVAFALLTVSKISNESVRFGLFCGVDHILLARTVAPIKNVVARRSIKHRSLLRDHPNRAP